MNCSTSPAASEKFCQLMMAFFELSVTVSFWPDWAKETEPLTTLGICGAAKAAGIEGTARTETRAVDSSNFVRIGAALFDPAEFLCLIPLLWLFICGFSLAKGGASLTKKPAMKCGGDHIFPFISHCPKRTGLPICFLPTPTICCEIGRG